MTIDELVWKYFRKPDHDGFDPDYVIQIHHQNLVKKITEIVQIKCEEQREICTANVKLKIEELDIRTLENVQYYGADIEPKYIVDINSIINSPTPNL